MADKQEQAEYKARTTEETRAPSLASIRARARKVLAAANIEYAHSYPSAIRGVKNWSRGVTIDRPWPDGIACIAARYDRAEARKQDCARAVAALRAAGWTVDDDGTIREVPRG